MRMKHLLSVMALAGPVCCGAFAQEIELKLAHNGGQGSLFDICAREYARRAGEQLDGRVKIAIYGQSQLGSDQEALATLRGRSLWLAGVEDYRSGQR